jgi:hypothetical protein
MGNWLWRAHHPAVLCLNQDRGYLFSDFADFEGDRADGQGQRPEEDETKNAG